MTFDPRSRVFEKQTVYDAKHNTDRSWNNRQYYELGKDQKRCVGLKSLALQVEDCIENDDRNDVVSNAFAENATE